MTRPGSRATRAVVRKELAALWATPLPYVVGVVFNAVAGILFVDQLAGRRQAVLQPLFPIAGFLVLVLAPLITMRSFAEEARTGTLDLLQAIPVRTRSLVAGKWLAAWVATVVAIAPSVLLPVIVGWWGQPDWGPVLTGFAGLVLLAATAAAVGITASACTDSQAVAAVAALFVGLASWFAATGTPGGWAGALSTSQRLRSFASGAIDTADLGYFVVTTAASLAAAAVCLDARRR